MRGFSKVVLAGNLTRDPEMRATTTGSQACNFTIAVNRVYKGSDGNMQEQVSYIDCVAWGKPGETIAQYTRKGSSIIVSGRLDQRSWEDKNSGSKSWLKISRLLVEDHPLVVVVRHLARARKWTNLLQLGTKLMILYRMTCRKMVKLIWMTFHSKI